MAQGANGVKTPFAPIFVYDILKVVMHAAWNKLVNMWTIKKRLILFVVFGLIALASLFIVNIEYAAAQPVPNVGVSDPVLGSTSPDPGGGGGSAPNPGAGTPGSGGPNPVQSADTDVLGQVMNMLAWMAEGVFQFAWSLVILMLTALIMIIEFEAFNDNGVIEVGWPIVRNAMNMFVILGLLFIAIKNLIPGQGDPAKAQGQIFKMLLAVVLMNFSQTIALLAIDFSQIVTLTFAQAISEIGSGNFVQLFGLTDHLALQSGAERTIEQGFGQGMLLLGTALFKLVMIGAVGVAVGVMLVALLLRIILLIFLVILSPAAFFAFGLGESKGMAGKVWSEWSKRFIGLLAFGPVLVFFLWLSLAIAANGNMASSVGFESLGGDQSTGLLQSAQPMSLLSTFVGIAMIFIGVGVAAQVASAAEGVGGIMNKGRDLTQGFIKRYSKKAARSTAVGGAVIGGAGALGGGVATLAGGTGIMSGIGAGVGAAGVAGVGGAAASQISRRAPGAARAAVRGADRLMSRVEGVPVIGGLAKELGVSELREGASMAAKALGGIDDNRRRAADEWVKNRDSRSLANDLENAQATLSSYTAGPQEIERARAVMQKFVTDKDFAKQYEGARGKDAATKMAQQAINQIEKDGFDHIEDEKEKAKAKASFLKFKAKRMDLLTEDQMEDLVNDQDFSVKMVSEEALKSGAVRNKLASKTGKTTYDSNGQAINKSMLTVIEEGGAGTGLQEFARNGYGALDNITDREGKVQVQAIQTPEQVARGIQVGKIKLDQMEDNEAAVLIKSFNDGVADGIESIADSKKLEELNSGVASKITEVIDKRIGALNEEIRNAEQAAQRAYLNAEDAKDEDARKRYMAERKKQQDIAKRAGQRKEKMRRAKTRVTKSADTYIDGGSYRSSEDRRRMQAVLNNDYNAATYIEPNSMDDEVAGDLATTFATSINSIRRDVGSIYQEKDKKKRESMKERMKQTLSRYEQAVKRGLSSSGASLTANQQKEYLMEISNLRSNLRSKREKVQDAAKGFIVEE